MAAERKLDIFRVLEAASTKDVDFYVNLTEQEEKALAPFVVQRWMSGTSSASQVYFINELLNPFVFTLANHKQLLWYLFTACGSGKKQKFSWSPLPGKKNTTKPLATQVVMEYYNYSTREAVDVLSMLTRSTLIGMAEDLGWQPDEISKLKKEVKGEDKTVDAPVNKPSRLIEF